MRNDRHSGGLSNKQDPSIARRFHYIYFAVDDEHKDDGEVVPGIGGSVYELLGLGSPEEKNRFTPDLAKERRRQFA